MKISIAFLIIFSSVLYFSCDEESNPSGSLSNNDNQHSFAPLKVGARWSYRGSIYGVDFMYTEEVVTKENDGFYKIKATISDSDTTLVNMGYRRVTNEGMMVYDHEKLNGEYELKKPFELGNAWSSRHDDVLHIYSIIDENIPFTTIAGTFTGCLKVEVKYTYISEIDTFFYREENIYAPGVGCVKYDFLILESYVLP